MLSWICDICSSSNDDSSVECFVCGQHRSEASIKEAKQRAKEEKRKNKVERIFKYSSKIAQVMFIASISISTLFATIMLIVLTVNGNLSLIISNIVTIGKHFGSSIKQTIGDNLSIISLSIYRSSLTGFADAIKNTGTVLISERTPEIEEKVVIIFNYFGKSFGRFGTQVAGLFSITKANVKTMVAILTLFIRNMSEQFSNLFDQFIGLLNRAIDKKNLFN